MKMINQKVSAWFVFFVLGMASFQSTNAQSLAIDPVDTFRLALGNGGADRLVKMKESLAAMKSAGEVGRALMLPEWQGQYRDGINKELFEPTVKRFVELARSGMQSKEVIVQRQTARIIAEVCSVNSGAQSYTGAERSVSRDAFLRQNFAELQEGLFNMASNDLGSQLDALYALGRIDSDPVKLASTVKAFFKQSGPEGLKKRTAASEAIGQRTYSVSVLARQGRYILPEDYDSLRKTFLTVGIELVPVAVIGLSDETRQVRVNCIDAINFITDALADSDILIRTSFDPALIERDDAERSRRMEEMKKEQKTLEPMMRMLRGQVGEIASQGLKSGRSVTTRVETLLILEDYAVFRKKLSDQCARLDPSLRRTGIVVPKELDPFPIDENGVNAVLAGLIRGLDDEESKVRLACASAVEMIVIQPDVMETVRSSEQNRLLSAILNLLRNESNPYVTLNLARVLSRIAPGKPELILPTVINLLGHVDGDVRIQALSAIRNFGPKAREAVPALTVMVVESDSDFRLAAMQAIEAVGNDAKATLPSVAKNLRHANPQVRTAAAKTLGRFGSMADVALAELDIASADSVAEVRMAVSEAIVRIRSSSR